MRCVDCPALDDPGLFGPEPDGCCLDQPDALQRLLVEFEVVIGRLHPRRPMVDVPVGDYL